MKISVVISAYNEEKKLPACLDSLKGFADEIIVVDNTSQDTTNKIAKKYTKHVYKRENNLMLNVNKNFGFLKATGDWIISLDADERITPELAGEIKKVTEKNDKKISGYWIPRKNIIFGKWIQNSIWWPDYQLRLFRNGKGSFEEKHVHEMITIDGETEKLSSPMIHENYESISQYLYKLDKIYTESEVKNIIASGKIVSWMDAIRFPLEDFLKTFFLQKGYKDGLHGLVLSLLQAFYSEIVFVKVWEKQGFIEYNDKNFLKNIESEFKLAGLKIQYWFLTSWIENRKNPFVSLSLRLKRKKIASKLP